MQEFEVGDRVIFWAIDRRVEFFITEISGSRVMLDERYQADTSELVHA